MPLVTWTDDYSVGVPSLDEQHKRWFGMINVLHQAMLDGEADDVVDALLLDVWEYTRVHFAEEEGLMEKYGFPGFKGHKRVHQHFIRQLKALMSADPAGKVRVTLEALQAMREWLVRHILVMDQHYSAFLIRKMAEAPAIQDVEAATQTQRVVALPAVSSAEPGVAAQEEDAELEEFMGFLIQTHRKFDLPM